MERIRGNGALEFRDYLTLSNLNNSHSVGASVVLHGSKSSYCRSSSSRNRSDCRDIWSVYPRRRPKPGLFYAPEHGAEYRRQRLSLGKYCVGKRGDCRHPSEHRQYDNFRVLCDEPDSVLYVLWMRSFLSHCTKWYRCR